MEQNETVVIDGRKIIGTFIVLFLILCIVNIYSIITAHRALADIERARKAEARISLRLKRVEATYGTVRRDRDEMLEQLEDIKAIISTY